MPHSPLDTGKFSLSKKLLTLVAVVCLCFAIIITLAIYSLYQAKDLSSGVVQTQMSELMSNSERTRDISLLFSKIHLLGFQFHESNPLLDHVGVELQEHIQLLKQKAPDSELTQSLSDLSIRVDQTLSTYYLIDQKLNRYRLLEQEIVGVLDQFESQVWETEFALISQGQNTLVTDQLESLINGYRQTLQQIIEINRAQKTILVSPGLRSQEDTAMPLILDLRDRLAQLPLSLPMVREYQDSLLQKLNLFYQQSSELEQQLSEFAVALLELATQEAKVLEQINKNDGLINGRASNLVDELETIIASSALTILGLSAVVMLAMALMVITLVRKNINGPIKKIVEGVEQFSQGQLLNRINLDTRDELSTISDSLNQMAEELHQSYSELKDSEDKFYQVFENEINALLIFDQDSGRCLDANRVALDLYEVGLDEIKKLHLKDLEHVAAGEQVIHTDGENWIDSYHCKQDGTVFPVEVHTGSFIRQGRRYLFKSVRDKTEQQRLESQQQHTRALLEATLESTNEGVVALTMLGDITNYNNKFRDLFGLTDNEIESGNIQRLLPHIIRHLKDKNDFVGMVRAAYSGQDTIASDVLEFNDGRMFECHSHPQLINGNLVGRVWNFRDVSEYFRIMQELRDKESRLAHIAHHDALTGLANRLLFLDRLEQSIRQAKRARDKIAVFFIDLDRFKSINDSLGHQVGDILLKSFSERLKSVVRQKDTIARLGGDEFTVILESVESPEAAAKVADKILETLKQPFTAEEHQFYVTSSIGISFYPDDGVTADELLKNADAAMYKSKDEGRNTYHFYTEEMTNMAFERVLMEAQLREALEQDQFVVYFQPQYDLFNGQLMGAEALIRWQHPSRGLLPPLDFLPIAEEVGILSDIDQWVFQHVAAQVADWASQGMQLDRMRFAVNLSGHQLRHEHLPQTFTDILRQTGCESRFLELEISEGFIMHQPETSTKVMEELKALGFELSIDDFGTGYSSLTYLKRLPLSKLKIDRSFVEDMAVDPNDAAIAKSVIALGHSMNLKIVAEGIETQEQKLLLKQEGCDMGQGFLLSKPILASELYEQLKADNSVIQRVI